MTSSQARALTGQPKRSNCTLQGADGLAEVVEAAGRSGVMRDDVVPRNAPSALDVEGQLPTQTGRRLALFVCIASVACRYMRRVLEVEMATLGMGREAQPDNGVMARAGRLRA